MTNKVICIGRQYGSGGREIGEQLAKRLGIPYYDKLLIQKAAEASGLSEEVIGSEEEKPVSSGYIFAGGLFADTAGVMNTFYSISQQVFDAEEKTIRSLASQGGCVIVGRCASSILRDSGALSVFVYSDMKEKIARVMKRNNISEKEAVLRIRRIDRMRRQFFDFYSDTSWGKPESYDLMLSGDRLGISACVDMIAACAEK